MSKDCILLIDDEEQFRTQFDSKIKQFEINLELIYFKDIGDFESKRKEINDTKVKFVIFDLCTEKGETDSKVFKIAPLIDEFFHKFRIIIFIHSAYLHHFEKYPDQGTVFKIEKGMNSIDDICSHIKSLEESHFHNIFSINGYIEEVFLNQIHSSFEKQFKGSEIIKIIKSIKESHPSDYPKRVREVFLRIAVRSLYHNLLSEQIDTVSEKLEEAKINAVEHYQRRLGGFPYWTGDVFKTGDNHLLILTPRCDIANGNCQGNFLACVIDKIDEKKLRDFSKGKEGIKNYIEDNIQNTGYKSRYLIPTPLYDGGKVDLTKHFIISQEDLKKSYSYVISLSDELTNDIIRKFASYLLRGGITSSELNEASYFSLQLLNEPKQY